MICPNPRCGKVHENVRGKCPYCGSDFHGHVGGKRAIKPRDLVTRYVCAHDILLCWPCTKCERSEEGCEVYRQSFLAQLKTIFIGAGVSKAEAWERAKEYLASVDAVKAQESG